MNANARSFDFRMPVQLGAISVLLALLLVPAALPAQPLAFTDVTVIDGTGAAPQPHMTVVVSRALVTTVGPTGAVPLPAGARVVNGTGKVLIPGLWDMHVHLLAYGQAALPLLLANGVTAVRDMGGSLRVIRDWRRGIGAGTVLGPRIVAAGPILDGPPSRGAPGRRAVATAAEGVQAVKDLKRDGVDFIKTHSLLPRDAYFAIAAEARREGLAVYGHVPDTVRLEEAIGAGQATVEHLTGLALACSSRETELRARLLEVEKGLSRRAAGLGAYVDARLRIDSEALQSYSASKAAAVFAQLVAHRVWQCPTLVTLRAATRRGIFREPAPALGQFDSPLGAVWWQPSVDVDSGAPFALFFPRSLSDLAAHSDQRERTIEMTPAAGPRESGSGYELAKSGRTDSTRSRQGGSSTLGARLFAQDLALMRNMHAAGVEFLAGTDLGFRGIRPGGGLHDELALLVRAGLTPMEALQAATRNPARVLNLEDVLGTVEPGKIANLVLLDGDPLADVHNTLKICAVVVNGRLLDRAALDKLVEGAVADAGDSP